MLALVTATAQADPCAKLEFAELESMPKEDLLKMRCEYTQKMLDPELYKAGNWGLNVANRCATESSRMDRIIGRKYQPQEQGRRLRPLLSRDQRALSQVV